MEFLNDKLVIVIEALAIIVLAVCLYQSETRMRELERSIKTTTNIGVGFDPLMSGIDEKRMIEEYLRSLGAVETGQGETMIGVAAFKNIQQGEKK